MEPYFDDAVAFVEWPEAAGDDLPPRTLAVRLSHAAPDRRLVSLAGAEASLLERVRRRVDPGFRHRDDDGDGSSRP